MTARDFCRYMMNCEPVMTEENCLVWIRINGFSDQFRIAKRAADRRARRAA